MDRRTRNLFLLALVAVVAVAAIAVYAFSGAGQDQQLDPDRTVVGVIVAVDSAGLNDVRGFRLRTDDGQTTEYTLGALVGGAIFPPSHLAEHQATAQPVRVWYVMDGSTRVAIRIDDAT